MQHRNERRRKFKLIKEEKKVIRKGEKHTERRDVSHPLDQLRPDRIRMQAYPRIVTLSIEKTKRRKEEKRKKNPDETQTEESRKKSTRLTVEEQRIMHLRSFNQPRHRIEHLPLRRL